MKQYLKFTASKWLVILNLCAILAKVASNWLHNAAKNAPDFPGIKQLCKWLLDLVAMPFDWIAGIGKYIFILDAIIIGIFLLTKIIKKIRRRRASVVSTSASTGMNTDAKTQSTEMDTF